MNIRLSLYVVGSFLKYLGLVMLVPGICSVIYKESTIWIFLASGLITSLTGYIIEKTSKHGDTPLELERKDGFLIASFCWIFASIFGAIPYLLFGMFTNPVDAIFESVSGFTTTGATVITNIEALPHSILLWRNFTQWLGGMGIIVLAIAILPRLSVGGMQLMGLETSGPTSEKITPRIAEAAKKLWAIYLFFTVLLVLLLILGGMPLFDSIAHSFSTLSIGGFSTNNLSIAAYNNPLIEIIITVFMILAGVNFVLHYAVFRGDFRKIAQNSELRFYIIALIITIIFVTLNIWMRYSYDFLSSFRFASFQVTSILTTTGFTTADFNLWPSFSKWMLFILMFVGACAGSTSGSVKMIRIMVLFKKAYREIRKIIYPRVVMPLRVDNKAVDEDAISSITSFFLLILFLFVLGAFLIMFVEGTDLITSISASAATIGNVGPGFGEVGALEHYAHFATFTKVLLCILMLVGRLELFTILVLFTPAFWRK